MERIYKSLTETLLEQRTKEENLIALFDFLMENMPLEHIICNKVDRKTKLFTSFIEYNLAEKISAYSFKLKTLVPIEKLNSFFHNNEIVIINLEDDKVFQDFYAQFPIEIESLMAMPFYIEKDFGINMFITCFSSQKNAFNNEHKKIFACVRPYLERILRELYLDNIDTKVFLNSKISLPNTVEEQLNQCPNLEEVVHKIKILAPHNTTILIQGPTGSGKELVATALHTLSTRNKKPFIPVNCSAIPENLVESEFFGYEKGAFTGATISKKGYFEQANLGTLFLDEVADLSPITQTRLLRVLETRQVQRIGAEKLLNLDVRIITATHKNLEALVKKGEFREDLYYRLKGVTIEIPPLNKRKKDIKVLVEYFYSHYIKKLDIQNPPSISYQTIRSLMEYDWPGNVRQLKMSIEEAIFEAIIHKEKEISFSFLKKIKLPTKRKTLTHNEITSALKEAQGKIQGRGSASEILKVNHSTLRSRMRALKIPFKV